jgi:hypothetical protein
MVQVGTSRQARHGAIQERETQRSRSKGRWWSARLKLTTTPTKLHFQRPEKPFKDFDQDVYWWWLRGKNHFIKSAAFPKGKFIECHPEQCLVCAYQNPGAYGFDVPADATLAKAESRPYYAVSGWVEQNFHSVEKKKDRKVGQGEKDTYHVRERCKGKSCEHCAKGLPKVFGNRFFYDFSAAAWRDAILPVIEKVERYTKDGGYIYPLNYVCEECSTELFDMTGKCFNCESEDVGIDTERHMAVCQKCDEEWTLLEYEDEELFNRANTVIGCPNKKCKHQGYPKPNFQHTDGKKKWESYDLYDVQLTLKKSSKDIKADTVVVAWELKEPDPRLFDAKYQGSGEAAEAIAKRHAELLDLTAIHSPDIPAVQAQMLGLDNLFGGAAGRASKQEFKKYNKKAKDSDDEDEDDADDDVDEEELDEDEDDSDDSDE